MSIAAIALAAVVAATGSMSIKPSGGDLSKLTPQTPQMTPEQREAIQRAFDLPPGSEVEVEITNRDGGALRTSNEGRGVGAGAVAEGDKLSDSFNGTPPSVGFGADGSQIASGGGAARTASASALKLPPNLWGNPLLWVGLACLGAAGFGFYAGLRRLGLIAGVAGLGLVTAAVFPVVLLFAAAAVAAALLVPYVYAEWKKRQAEQSGKSSMEALRAVVAGVEDPSVPAEAQKAVKAAVAKEADAADRAAIDEVKRSDKVGKYAD